jgi:hypothetical protein
VEVFESMEFQELYMGVKPGISLNGKQVGQEHVTVISREDVIIIGQNYMIMTFVILTFWPLLLW